MNGAGIIHDFEIALSGATSEDVDEALGPGPLRHGGGDRAAAERGDSRAAPNGEQGLGQAVARVPRRAAIRRTPTAASPSPRIGSAFR